MFINSFIVFSYCLQFCFSTNSIEEPLTDNGIYVLNKDNFNEFINSNNVVMVEFYAPWCGHCKSFAPIYSEAAEQLKASGDSIPLCKVDATVETDLSNRFSISGFPTLKFFKSGVVYDYDEDRSASSIVKFMKTISSPEWKPPKSNVLVLTKENFTEVVEKSGYILVEFFAPWCGHCKNLAPEYAKAATILAKEKPSIPLAVVDATMETELAKQYNITGYPALKLFRNNKIVEYNGPRYTDGIVEWMIKNKENAAQKVLTISDLKQFRNPQKILLLGIFSNENDLLFSTYTEAANLVRDDFLSVYTFSDEIRKLYGCNVNDGIGSVLLLRPEYLSNKYESDYIIYQHDENTNSVDTMVSFYENDMFPIVAEYNSETSLYLNRFKKENLCIFFFTVDFSVHHRTATRKWLEKITKIAVDYKTKIQFAIADDERQSDKLRELRLDDSGEEINVGCIKKDSTKYRMSPMEEFDSDHIRQFIDNVLSDKIFPLLKSAPIPKTHLSSGIKTVVGDTYKTLINDINKKALIILYRSPCEKCKASRNVLSALSSKLSGRSLDFFSMDLNQNDLPPINGLENVDSEPSLYLIVDNPDLVSGSLLKKRFIKYMGDHLNEADIRSFVMKNTKLANDEL